MRHTVKNSGNYSLDMKPFLHAAGSAWKFVKKNAVMFIALIAALVTSMIVPPDEKYLGYIDFKTVACLFCTLGVICALRNIKFFTYTAQVIVEKTSGLKTAILTLVGITYVGSMLIANDMALITFLPLGYNVLKSTGREKYMAFTFIMQNIAANLGGMLTPFGNPQNLFLYSRFSIPTGEFMLIMLPPFIAAAVMIAVCCMFVKNEKIEIKTEKVSRPDTKRTVIFCLLFVFALLIVFRVVHYLIGLAVITVALLIIDRKALAKVDYGLLFTFVFFFIFAGNMARIDVVADFLSDLVGKNTLLVSTLSCQAISNVPTAVLLSGFTDNYRELLQGVNIGGVGTLIASLASLITYREYVKDQPGKGAKYIGMFSVINFSFLAVLLIVCMVFR